MSEPTQPQNDQGPVTLTIPGEKFTEKMRLVLDFAQEEARELHHNYIGTEHLLLGLLREGESIAYNVLHSLGVELEAVRRAVTFIVGPGKEAVIGEIGFTPRAVAATTLAFNEAGHLGQEKIAPEHLLLGLTSEGEGIAAGLMRAFGTTLEKVRAQTFQAIALASGGKAAEQPSPKSNVVTCRIDGRDLDAVDALIEVGIRSTRSMQQHGSFTRVLKRIDLSSRRSMELWPRSAACVLWLNHWRRKWQEVERVPQNRRRSN